MLDEQIMTSYLPVILIIMIAFALGIMVVLVPILTGIKHTYKQKNSQYECGFKALGSTRKKFDVKFYLISILFIVFDIEIAFLFPWSISLKEIGFPAFLSMMLFITILVIGFIYEWKKGVLDG